MGQCCSKILARGKKNKKKKMVISYCTEWLECQQTYTLTVVLVDIQTTKRFQLFEAVSFHLSCKP